MIIAKGMTSAEAKKYGITGNGLALWSKETGKTFRQADAKELRKSNLTDAYSVEISNGTAKMLEDMKRQKTLNISSSAFGNK